MNATFVMQMAIFVMLLSIWVIVVRIEKKL